MIRLYRNFLLTSFLLTSMACQVEYDYIPPEGYIKSTPYRYGEVVEIPGGWFDMGNPFHTEAKDDAPVHRCFVSTFTVSVNLVTFKEYVSFINESGIDINEVFWQSEYFTSVEYIDGKWRPKPGKEFIPVHNTTWNGARAFCEWLSISDDTYTYRLPTEAEWEYMASNAGTTISPWGSKRIEGEKEPSEFKGRYLGYYPIGTRPENANQWGVLDLVGSCEQWCYDFYSYTTYRDTDRRNPRGPSSSKFPSSSKSKSISIRNYRVIRGGPMYASGSIWNESYSIPTSYNRGYYSGNSPGFRMCRNSFRWVREKSIGKQVNH